MFFSEPPPQKAPEPTALVRPAESPEGRAVRLEASSFLKELRENVRDHLEGRAAILRQAMAAAQADFKDSQSEYKALTFFDSLSVIGVAARRQLELDSLRVQRFTSLHEAGVKNLMVLSQAERCIEEGRFEESLPFLKILRQETLQKFPSAQLMERVQRAADRKPR